MNEATSATARNLPDNGVAPRFGGGGLVELAKRSAVVWAVGALFVLLILGAAYAIDVLLLAFAGLLFAVLLRSLSNWLSRSTTLGEKVSLALVVLVLLGAAVGGMALLTPPLAKQVDQLQQTLPQSLEQLQQRIERYPWGRWALAKAPAAENLMPSRGDALSRINRFLTGTLGALGSVVVIFFTGLFFASQPRLYVDGLVRLVPQGKRGRARDVLEQIGAALQGWLLGMLVSMTIVGVLTWLGLWALGIEMALALGVLAAVLTFIPNFGPILSAVPAVLVALMDSPMMALWVILLYVVIQTVESYLVTPLIQQRAVSLPPALIITAQLMMGVLAGGLGLALATPLTAAGLVLVRTLYVQDLLGDDEAGED